jgi:hypothetical protein
MTKMETKMQKQLEMDPKVWLTESQYEVLKTLANAVGDTPEEWLHDAVIQGLGADIDVYFGTSKTIKRKLFKMAEELSDLRIILISFMADKEAHKKIPCLGRRAPKLWSKVDRMYEYRQKETRIGRSTSSGTNNWQ